MYNDKEKLFERYQFQNPFLKRKKKILNFSFLSFYSKFLFFYSKIIQDFFYTKKSDYFKNKRGLLINELSDNELNYTPYYQYVKKRILKYFENSKDKDKDKNEIDLFYILLDDFILYMEDFNKSYKVLFVDDIIKKILLISVIFLFLNKLKNKINRKKLKQIKNFHKFNRYKIKIINVLLYYGLVDSIFIEKRNNTRLLLFIIDENVGFHLPLKHKYLISIKKFIDKEFLPDFINKLSEFKFLI